MDLAARLKLCTHYSREAHSKYIFSQIILGIAADPMSYISTNLNNSAQNYLRIRMHFECALNVVCIKNKKKSGVGQIDSSFHPRSLVFSVSGQFHMDTNTNV